MVEITASTGVALSDKSAGAITAGHMHGIVERIAELEAALKEAIEGWEDGANYKGDYLRAKHGDTEDIARVRAVLQNSDPK
jgi:hypothetical protein